MAAMHRVPLESSEYWELRAKIRDVEVADMQARQAVSAAMQARNAAFDALAAKYGLDSKLAYECDDRTCELIVRDAPNTIAV